MFILEVMKVSKGKQNSANGAEFCVLGKDPPPGSHMMEIIPEIVHQRVPIILGSKHDVQEIIDAYSAAS